MANKRSEACPYPSRYGVSRWVSAAQYLAEMMCERRAKIEKRTLPAQFWEDKYWGKIFRQQVVAISRIIDRLDPKLDEQGRPDPKKGKRTGTAATALSRFVRSDRGKNMYSLAAPWIVPHIDAIHQAVLSERHAQSVQSPPPPQEETLTVPLPAGPRGVFVRDKSTLTRLKELDG